MDLFFNIEILVVGFILLIKGADYFVEGASNIAKILKVPSLIVGLTIVALGTSLPELSVSVVAAINTRLGIAESVDLSVGNVVGSNICNTLLVLGTTCVLIPVFIEKKILKFEIPFVLMVSVLLLIASVTGEKAVTWYYGVIFLVLLVFYITFLIIRTKKEGVIEDETVDRSKKNVLKSILYLLGGAAAIALGGENVDSSVEVIAEFFGMEQKLIALTVVAIGTSLPELVTSVVAIKKGENDIALGNVIGSNILNILFILGIAAIITPLPISTSLNFDLIYLVGITFVLIIMSFAGYKSKKGINRIDGIILLVLYVIYMFLIIGRNYGFITFIG